MLPNSLSIDMLTVMYDDAFKDNRANGVQNFPMSKTHFEFAIV